MTVGRYFKTSTLRVLAHYIVEDVDGADIFEELERTDVWDLTEEAARNIGV